VTDKTVTEREAVLRERAAFVAGLLDAYIPAAHAEFAPGAAARAVRRYPLPKVTRPRVVRSQHTGRTYCLWGGGDGVVVKDHFGRQVHDMGSHVEGIPLIDVPLVAALLANPLEAVEDES
jgi:hypothetical protein